MCSLPCTCQIVTPTNFSSKPNNLYFIYIFFSLSLSKLPPNIHSLFIFTSSFCLFPSSFCSTVTPTIHYHLRFVLLSSQAWSRFIVSFLSIFFSPFFPKISLSRYEKFSVFTFRPGRNGTIFKTLVQAASAPFGEAKKKRHRSDTGVRRVWPVCRTPVLCQKWRVGAT